LLGRKWVDLLPGCCIRLTVHPPSGEPYRRSGRTTSCPSCSASRPSCPASPWSRASACCPSSSSGCPWACVAPMRAVERRVRAPWMLGAKPAGCHRGAGTIRRRLHARGGRWLRASEGTLATGCLIGGLVMAGAAPRRGGLGDVRGSPLPQGRQPTLERLERAQHRDPFGEGPQVGGERATDQDL